MIHINRLLLIYTMLTDNKYIMLPESWKMLSLWQIRTAQPKFSQYTRWRLANSNKNSIFEINQSGVRFVAIYVWK